MNHATLPSNMIPTLQNKTKVKSSLLQVRLGKILCTSSAAMCVLLCQSCSWAKLKLSDITHLYPLIPEKLAVFSKDTLQVGGNTGTGSLLGRVLHAVSMTSLSKAELLLSLIYINMLAVSVNFQLQLWHKQLQNRLIFFSILSCFNSISSGEQLPRFRNIK